VLSKLESYLFGFFLLVLVWAPLPFASNRVWSGALLTGLLGLLFCGWLLLFALGRAELDSLVWRRARWPVALLVVIQLWVFLQIQPIPREWVQLLSPQAYAWHIKGGWLTLSLDPEAGRYYLLRGCAITMGFFLAVALVNSHKRVKLLMQVLVVSGTFQATYGAFMVLSGLELGFFVEKYTGVGVATGTFVNRNHLAGYLVMCLSVGIGLLLSQLTPSTAVSWRDRAREWLQLLLSPKIRLRLYLALMVVALVLTRARMGNIAFFVSLGLAGVVALTTGRRFSWRTLIFLASLLIVDLLILGKWFGFDQLAQRLEQTNPATESRAWSNEYSIDYIKDFPLTGSGSGSFYGVFPNYQAADLAGFHLHAHNDYLEFAAELGIPALLLLLGFAGLSLWNAWCTQRSRRNALYKGAGFAATMTLCWAAIHSTTDFNLQIPANALTFVVIAALAFICRELKGPVSGSRPAGSVTARGPVRQKTNNG
jgi:O-antigen ligase